MQTTSEDHCPPKIPVFIMVNDLFRKLKISFYRANEVFLPLFLTQVFLLLLYFWFTVLVHPKNTRKSGFCNFFICMLMSKEKPVRVLIGKYLSLHGWKLKLDPDRLILFLGGSRIGQVQLMYQ